MARNGGDEALALFLERLTKRSVLNGEEREAVLALPMREKRYAPGEDIVGFGEEVHHSCLVGDGFAARFAETADGDRQSIALHIAGDMADLHSVVSPKAITPLQALSACSIYQIPHAELRRAANRFNAIAYAFWRDGIVDAAIIAQSVLNLGQRKAPARIAHVFCEIAVRKKLDISKQALTFGFPITQKQLGELVGLHAVHVNRTLKKLRADGLVTMDDGTVNILSWRGLAERAAFDPFYLQLEPLDFHAGDRR